MFWGIFVRREKRNIKFMDEKSVLFYYLHIFKNAASLKILYSGMYIFYYSAPLGEKGGGDSNKLRGPGERNKTRRKEIFSKKGKGTFE